MKQKDKELLLKDLCGRLPYGVKLETDGGIEILDTLIVSNGWINASYDIDEVKPYLRPLSSMTRKERGLWNRKFRLTIAGIETYVVADFGESEHIPISEIAEMIAWLNAHHFDYNGLIGRGLALEAPEGMYNS